MSEPARCNWENCLYEGPRKDAVFHVILNHVTDVNKIPFYCTLCQFRAKCQKSLDRHVKTYRQHKQLDDGSKSSAEYLSISKDPYNVTWSKTDSKSDLRILSNSAEENTVEEIVEIVNIEEIIDFDCSVDKCIDYDCSNDEYIDCSTQTETTCNSEINKLKQELEEEKRKRQQEQLNFGNYVQRLENKIKIRDELISNLRAEIRRNEPMVGPDNITTSGQRWRVVGVVGYRLALAC